MDIPARPWSYPLRTVPEGSRAKALLSRLGWRPLRLQFDGMWDPLTHYWGEPGEPIEPIFQTIIRAGPRPSCTMEQVLPGVEPGDDDDPITWAAELMQAGERDAARAELTATLSADARCIDAHGHLGNLMFDRTPRSALVHYQTGVAIGERSLPSEYTGVLLWGHIDNRPFLRCLHGMALSLWRLGRLDEAAAAVDALLWLNPSDNQGARFLRPEMADGQPWHPD